MEENHMVVTYTININSTRIKTIALLGMCASGYAFINENFALQLNTLLHPLKILLILDVIDGRPIALGDITDITRLPIDMDEYSDEILIFVA